MYRLREVVFGSPDVVNEFDFKSLLPAFKFAEALAEKDDYLERISAKEKVYKFYQAFPHARESVKLFQSKQRVLEIRKKFVQLSIK